MCVAKMALDLGRGEGETSEQATTNIDATRPMSKLGGGAAPCVRCKKSVYFNELVTGPGGSYHKSCMTCKECNKRLDSTTLAERENEAYCKSCYGRLFGPKGYGYGGGAGTLSTEAKPASFTTTTSASDLAPPEASAEASKADESTTSGPLAAAKHAQEPAAAPSSTSATNSPSATRRPQSGTATKFGGTDACPKCTKAVYFAEQVLGPGGVKYHKMCFKCTDCGKMLDTGTVVDKENVVFCKPCHGRKFGPKGYGYAAGGGFLNSERAG